MLYPNKTLSTLDFTLSTQNPIYTKPYLHKTLSTLNPIYTWFYPIYTWFYWSVVLPPIWLSILAKYTCRYNQRPRQQYPFGRRRDLIIYIYSAAKDGITLYNIFCFNLILYEVCKTVYAFVILFQNDNQRVYVRWRHIRFVGLKMTLRLRYVTSHSFWRHKTTWY